MARNKGYKFWENLINQVNGRDLTEEEFEYCDELEDSICKTEADKQICCMFIKNIVNHEQTEDYFKREMLKVVDAAYHGVDPCQGVYVWD